MRRACCIGLVLLSACSERSQIALQYRLGNIDLGTLVRVETWVSVDPSDRRGFFADQPYRSVAQGVGYEVRDFDGSGARKLLITHDATLGYAFAPNFVFTLLPPAGESAPALVVMARAVGASTMLGRTPDVNARFAVNATVTLALADDRCNGVYCDSDQMCCHDACVNTASDPANCGGCDQACAPKGDSCQGGGCTCAGGSACSGASTCCPGLGCIDTTSDPFNCGVCGHACNPGETCSGGQCGCNGGPACSSLCCASGCSMTGSCDCGGTPCGAPSVCCNGTSCLDIMNDNANCGACGHACPSGLVCDAGACKCHGQICSGGDTCCDSGCANLMSSTTNCGTCGHACAANETCTGGACECGTSTCTTGQTCCGQSCKMLASDSANCGACGHACNAGEQCVAGSCVCPGTQPARACSLSETCCPAGSNGTAGGCFDLTSDHDHCMSCGNACNAISQCIRGACVQTSCNPPCTNGSVCDPGTLTCKCGSGPACGIGLYCCSGNCVNRLADDRNCGACGNDVRPNLCCNGTATPHSGTDCQGCGKACIWGDFCCNTGGLFDCVPNGPQNCGGCGIVCKDSPVCCVCGPQGYCAMVCPAVACTPP
jgi:hypothetical protein